MHIVSLILTLWSDKSKMPKLWNIPITACQSSCTCANMVAH